MKQLPLFTEENKIPSVPGLQYFPNYISSEEEDALVKIIDQQHWLQDLKRRVQHYGYKYDYTAKTARQDLFLGDIPDWLTTLCKKLFDKGIFKTFPDQVIINEYLSGQGISPHVDCIPCFTETICSISLLSPCSMELSKNEEKTSIFLEPRSLLVLSGPARFKWKHGIANRKQDVLNGQKILRERRISITFRKMKF